MLQILLVRWIKENCFVTIEREKATKGECFELHGYPPWWDKGRSQLGGARGSNKRQGNYNASAGELPVVDMQALEDFKSKLKLSEGSSSSQGSSKVDSISNAITQGMESHQA